MIHKGIQINETTKNNTHETHTQAISSHQSVSDKKVYYREETVGSGVEPDNTFHIKFSIILFSQKHL